MCTVPDNVIGFSHPSYSSLVNTLGLLAQQLLLQVQQKTKALLPFLVELVLLPGGVGAVDQEPGHGHCEELVQWAALSEGYQEVPGQEEDEEERDGD